VQVGAPAAAWVTAKVLFAMLADPDRCDHRFWVQDTVTVWAPTPLVGLTVIQATFPFAVQLPPVQPEGDPVRVTVVCPLAAGGFADAGQIEKEVHVAAACVTTKALLAMLADPDRCEPVFEVQETVTV